MAEISPVGFDATIRHATYLERLKAEQVRQITPMLRQIDEKLRARLSKGELTTFGRARLERLLESIDKQLKGILDEYGWGLSKELTALAKVEAAFEASSLAESVKNPRFEATVPAPAKIVAAAMASPLGVKGIHGGKLLKGFIKGWSDAQRDTLTGIIRTGSVSGQTNAEIIRAIRGDARLGFRNGALAQTRNQTAAMTRTAVQHISHQARLATLQANSRVVKKYRWLSTLDDRTSELCQGLSGEEFEVGNGPIPPAHVNCRSTIVAVLEGELAEELRKGRKQASQFGPVDAKENYFDWMKRQPAAFQDDALGPVKARLLRRGGLSGEEFRKLTRADNFRPLTLAEMAKKNPLAFEKAGIRITPGGRAIIEGSKIQTIKANLPPAPKAKPIVQKPSDKLSLKGPGVAPKTTEDFLNWQLAGTFDGAKRVSKVVDAADAPGRIAAGSGGAYYNSLRGIHMGAKEGQRSQWFAQSTMRHEWGHYLDDILGEYARKDDAFLAPLLRKLAGKPPSGWGYFSSFAKPKAALLATKKHLETLGKRIVKQTNPNSKVRVFSQGIVENAWEKRYYAIADELAGQPGASAEMRQVKAAKGYLQASETLIAKIYRRIVELESMQLNDVEAVLFAEAAKAGDLSILFYKRGRYLANAMKRKALVGKGLAVDDGGFSGLSDLMGASTKENVAGYNMGFGHGKAYYASRGFHGQATEAFANITDLEHYRRADALVDEIVRALVPDWARWYDDLLDQLNTTLGG